MTTDEQGASFKSWGAAWIGLTLALALHITDEALTGFLPLYNETVEHIRTLIPWFPFPTFTFRVWLSGLIGLVVVLLALSPLIFRGRAWLRPVAYLLSIIMVANAFGHTAASLYWGMLAPGVYSSPVLLVAAVALLITTRRSRRQPRGASGA